MISVNHITKHTHTCTIYTSERMRQGETFAQYSHYSFCDAAIHFYQAHVQLIAVVIDRTLIMIITLSINSSFPISNIVRKCVCVCVSANACTKHGKWFAQIELWCNTSDEGIQTVHFTKHFINENEIRWQCHSLCLRTNAGVATLKEAYTHGRNYHVAHSTW